MTKRHPKSVRDYRDSDIKPMMVKNRERGQKTKSTAIHKYLQRTYGDAFSGQLRTLQRMVREVSKELDMEDAPRIKKMNEPYPEIFFPQEHPPGAEAQLDCTSLANLGITIQGRPFRGKIFTFKLMHSKWLCARIVQGETASEVLTAIVDALENLGGVPLRLRSDNGKALFRKKRVPTDRFDELCRHYGTTHSPINPGRPNENGGAETGNRTIKGMLLDRLTTDTDPNFASEDALVALLEAVVAEYNGETVASVLNEERKQLKRLPSKRMEPYVKMARKVDKEGMIRHNSRYYSTPRELHGKRVDIRLYPEHMVIYNEGGEPAWQWTLAAADVKHRADFRHVIHWLRRKPSSFNNCCYKEDLFPTEIFKTAYDNLERWYVLDHAVRIYLAILTMATGPDPIRQDDDNLINEVQCALELLLESQKPFDEQNVAELVEVRTELRPPRQRWQRLLQFGPTPW